MAPSAAAIELLKANVTPFSSLSENGADTAQYFDSFSDCKILLLGDASHGTSEFYAARAEIAKYMIENQRFNIVAVEADWPDFEVIDRYVRHRPGPGQGTIEPTAQAEKAGREPAFMRFLTWMWRSMEVHDFMEWLRKYNKGGADADEKYLNAIDQEMAEVSRERYGNLMEWAEHPHEYDLETLVSGFKGYEKDVIAMLKDLLSKRIEYSMAHWDGIEFHSGEQNARVVADAEKYYRAMYYGRDESWNLRDTHMFQTLVRILKHRGENSKAIVWAHNSHIGDARATSMGWSRSELNIGQLCKETYGTKALSIGCLGNTGTVAAAKRWDGDMQVMKLRPGLPDSYEELMHATGIQNFMLDLRKKKCDKKLRELLSERRLERFIGVLYKPATERQSHYSKAVLPEQFDGVIWFDESRHVGTLEVHQPKGPLEYDETWPLGCEIDRWSRMSMSCLQRRKFATRVSWQGREPKLAFQSNRN